MRPNLRILWLLGAMLAGSTAIPAGAGEHLIIRDGMYYVSGGVGEDSVGRLNARARDFNLKLVFTLNEGNYLTDVNVVIVDAKGAKLIEHTAEGPLFFARLPAGQYSVTATNEGKAVTRKVTVGASNLRAEYFRWPANPETDFPLLRAAKE
jgi:hypothetical protein